MKIIASRAGTYYVMAGNRKFMAGNRKFTETKLKIARSRTVTQSVPDFGIWARTTISAKLELFLQRKQKLCQFSYECFFGT